jgi:hypothetical protein
MKKKKNSMRDSLLLAKIRENKFERQQSISAESISEYPCSVVVTGDNDKKILSVSGFLLLFQRYFLCGDSGELGRKPSAWDS